MSYSTDTGNRSGKFITLKSDNRELFPGLKLWNLKCENKLNILGNYKKTYVKYIVR